MQGRLTIFLTVVVVLVLLLALNAASYVEVEERHDAELAPDRSTLNASETGTRAFYDYLHESGFDVVRWRTSPADLLKRNAERPHVFVIVGQTRREISRDEATAILRWVRDEGGRLVIIDRTPEMRLLPTVENWRVSSEIFDYPEMGVRAGDIEQMTKDAPILAPALHSVFTRHVKEVRPSRFASRLHIYPVDKQYVAPVGGRRGRGAGDPENAPPPPPAPVKSKPIIIVPDGEEDVDEENGEDDENVDEAGTAGRAAHLSPAPVEHLPDGREGRGALLVDYLYGRGRIVVLSDPFIISNAGLRLGDNLQLAVNLVGGESGRIAFDEFHQRRGAGVNPLLGYFAGTPVPLITAQGFLRLLAVVWTRSRRFARPLPAPRVDRRSSHEYVASMGELQQRARAYDLALENIYTRTRRALARYAGLPNTTHHTELAARVAARSGREAAALEALFRECEDAIAGERLTARRTLELVADLRALERDLGIRMREREIRQARL